MSIDMPIGSKMRLESNIRATLGSRGVNVEQKTKQNTNKFIQKLDITKFVSSPP